MNIRYISLSLSLVFLGLFSLNLTHAASLDEAWQAFQDSHYEEAQTQFSQLHQEDHAEEALRGLLLCAAAKGDYPAMAKHLARLIRNYSSSPYLSTYLAFGGMSPLHGWTPEERLEVFDHALKQEIPHPHRQWLEYERAETLDMLLDNRSGQAARKAGILIDHWNLAGPFGRFGASDFFRPFGPEIEWKENYSGWQQEVSFHPMKYTDCNGMLDFDGLLNPSTGVAYALNVIESDEDTEALLTIHSPSDFRLWWNGEPLAEKSHLRLDTRRVVSVPISLNKGKNLLVLKSRQHRSWWLRAKIQSQEDQPLPIRSVPFDLQEMSQYPLKPFEQAAPDLTRDSYQPNFAFLQENANPFQNHLMMAIWHLDRRNYDQVKDVLEEAIELAPDGSLAHEWQGDANLRHAKVRSSSTARFQKNAENAYQRALDLDPQCRGALIGLLTYYMDRDQTDQALDLINEHINEHPEVMEQGYPGALHYAYGGLYSKKQFVLEAAREYLKALDDSISSEQEPPLLQDLLSRDEVFLPSFELLRHLISFYDGNKNVTYAVDAITQALDIFPAYTPFLEKALRFPDEVMEKMDVDELLRRANKMHPYETRYALMRGNLLENLGQFQPALDWYEELQDRFPNHPQIEEWKASLAYSLQQKEEAEEIFTSLYQRKPTRQKPFHFLRDVTDKNDFSYMKYDVQLDDIDISKSEKWEDSRASVVYLLDIMVMELYEDGTHDQYIHQAMKIMNQEGKRKWAEVVIPQGDNIEIIEARTIAPDGTEWAVSDVQDLSGKQSLSMYSVEVGSIVEYAYLQRGGRDDPGVNVTSGGYYFGADDDPMQLSKMTIVQHEGATLHLAANPTDFEPEITQQNNQTIYQWENRMQDGLKEERFGPHLAERVPSIQWTTCPDWLTFAERQRATLYGYEETSQAVHDLAQSLLQDAENPEDFVHNLYRWIQENIEDSSGGRTTADTVELRAGGRYQKIRLMRHLLRLGDVDSHLAHALENDKQDGFPPLPYPNYPGHTMLVIPEQEGIPERLAADFTSRFAPLNNIDPMVEKMVLFVYDTPTPYFEPLRSHLWEAGLLRRQVEAQVLSDRSANLEGRYTYDILYDKQVREALTNPEVEKRLADSQLSRDFSGIQIQSYEFDALEDLNQPPQLHFVAKVPDLVKQGSRSKLTLRPILTEAQTSNFVTESTRESPMVFENSPIRSPFQARFDMTEWIEAGAQIILPENSLIINEFGYYSTFYEWEGNSILVRRSLLLPPQEISPERYPAFVEFCRTIDQLERREITISPPMSSE